MVQRPTVLSTVTIRAQRKYCACETLIGENYTGQQIFLEAKKNQQQVHTWQTTVRSATAIQLPRKFQPYVTRFIGEG